MRPTPLLLLLLLLPLLLLSLPAAAAGATQDDPPPPSSPSPPFRSPADAVAARPDLSLLVAAVDATGLNPQFSSPDLPLTIFAPNNAALLKASQALDLKPEQILSQNRTLLFDVLRYHVVPGAPLWSLERLRHDNPRLITLLPGAEPLEIRTMSSNGSVLIGGGLGPTAMVVDGDIFAGKSVIHVIDEVMLPGTLLDLLVPSPSPAAAGSSPPPPSAPPQRNGA